MDDEEENVSLVCKKCNKEFISKINLTNHINKNICSKSRTRFACNFCSKTFLTDGGLTRHMMSVHKDNYTDNDRQFMHNNIVFTLNKDVSNHHDLIPILNDFNISTLVTVDPNQNSDPSDNESTVSEINKLSFINSSKDFCIKHKNNFIISLLNINSLQHKFADISFLLTKQLVDILVINETKLNPLIDDNRFKNELYLMIRRDRPEKGGGGIMVFIKKTIVIKSILIDEKFEIISFIFSPNPKLDISLIACYRPPHIENEDPFLHALDKKVIEMSTDSTETVIIGDLNFNQLDKADKGKKLNQFSITHGFSNTNTEVGTCYNKRRNEWSLLDLILCYFLNFLVAFKIIPNAISDRHAMVFAAFDYKKSHCKPPRKRMRCLSKEKISAIAISIKNILTDFSSKFHNPNEHWRIIKDIIISCMDAHAPYKTVPLKASNNFPWIDKNYIGLSIKRDALYYKATKYGSNLFWENYKKIRNKC